VERGILLPALEPLGFGTPRVIALVIRTRCFRVRHGVGGFFFDRHRENQSPRDNPLFYTPGRETLELGDGPAIGPVNPLPPRTRSYPKEMGSLKPFMSFVASLLRAVPERVRQVSNGRNRNADLISMAQRE